MPQSTAFPAAASLNDVIYCFGGYGSTTNILNSVLSYSPGGTWTNLSSTGFTPRFAACAAVVNGKIYVIGGSLNGNTPSNAVECYDPTTNTWLSKSNSGFTPRSHASCVVINGKIYVFGGSINPNFDITNAVEVYDPNRDRWESQQYIGSTIRAGTVAGVFNGKAYVFAGITGHNGASGQIVSTLEIFDPLKISMYWFRKN